MTDNLKIALNCVRAEQTLKSDTIRFLQEEIQRRGKTAKRGVLGGYAAALASVLIIVLSGIFAYNVYFTPAAYVDVDVNPSVELTLNRFDRVIGAHAYNDDGQSIIGELSIKHKSYDDALIALMEAVAGQGYLQDGALVSVTLQTDNDSKQTVLLANIQNGIESYLTGHHHQAQVDIFPVSGDTREHSYELNISPAKYLAIQELIEVDPTASIESCRGHSISEIKQLTMEHGKHHGNGGQGASEASDSVEADEETDAQTTGQSGAHHGNGHGGGHHQGGR